MHCVQKSLHQVLLRTWIVYVTTSVCIDGYFKSGRLYLYASVCKTYSLESFLLGIKNSKFKAQDKLKYGFHYENQIKYIYILVIVIMEQKWS